MSLCQLVPQLGPDGLTDLGNEHANLSSSKPVRLVSLLLLGDSNASENLAQCTCSVHMCG